jgi:hypothetical protein
MTIIMKTKYVCVNTWRFVTILISSVCQMNDSEVYNDQQFDVTAWRLFLFMPR